MVNIKNEKWDGMKQLLLVICIMALIQLASADDLIFFADDHYKVIGAPQLEASAANPVFDSGSDAVLRISLANRGRIDELIPTQENGSAADAAKEMHEEMHSIDALNITAQFHGNSDVNVTSGLCNIDSLPSGSVAQMVFNISIGTGASGWYELPLHLDYEHQADVVVSGGLISPLYQPDNTSQGIRIFVQGKDSLSVEGVKSDLSPGGRGTILAAIKNGGSDVLRNCTARLITAPPFRSSGTAHLGDIAANQLAVANFAAEVDGNASIQDYRLACELDYDGGSAVLSVPVTLRNTSNQIIYASIFVIVMIAIGGIFMVWRKRSKRSLRRR